MRSLQYLPQLIDRNTPIAAVESPVTERLAILQQLHTWATERSLPLYYWNCGYPSLQEVRVEQDTQSLIPTKPASENILQFLIDQGGPGIFILEGILEQDAEALSSDHIYQLMNAFYELPHLKHQQHWVLLGDAIQLPNKLLPLIPMLSNPLPKGDQLTSWLQNYLSSSPIEFTPETLIALTKACLGLPLGELQSVLDRTLLQAESLTDLAEQVISHKVAKLRGRGLEFISEPDVPAGGLDLLERLLDRAAALLAPQAKEFGLTFPKGIILWGPPGTGKSLSAKHAAKKMGVPLIAADWGGLISNVPGESEANLRFLLEIVEVTSPCVTGDSLVVLADGRVRPIADIWEDRHKYQGQDVISFNEESLELEPSKIELVTKKNYTGNLYEIETQFGTIQATDNHLFPVLKNGEIVWQRADCIETNSFIAHPSTTTLATQHWPEITTVDLLPDARFYITKELFVTALDLLQDQGFRRNEFSERISRESYYLRASEVAKINIELPNPVKTGIGKGGFTDSISYLPSYIDPSTAYISGLLFGDGTYGSRTVRFFNTCSVLVEHVHRWSLKYLSRLPKLRASVKSEKTGNVCETWEVGGKILASFFKSLDQVMLQASPELIRHWIAGLFDAEGSIVNDRVAITSIQKKSFGKTFKHMVHMFNRVGLPLTSTSKVGTSYLTGHYAEKFVKDIPLQHPDKQKPLVSAKRRRMPKIDLIPIGAHLSEARGTLPRRTVSTSTGQAYGWEKGQSHPSRVTLKEKIPYMQRNGVDTRRIELLTHAPVMWTKVNSVKVQPAVEVPVYDLCLAGNHNFIANGLFVHNCILYWDDFDKAFAGWDSNAGGGVQRRLAGKLLTWMQERVAPVFVIATVNRLEMLPAELNRRFDDIVFVDLPHAGARKDIFDIHLHKYTTALHGQEVGFTEQQWHYLLREYNLCTAAEVGLSVRKAAEEAFYQGRPGQLTLEDLIYQRRQFTPTMVREEEQLLAIRKRATNARPASSPDQSKWRVPPAEMFKFLNNDEV